MEKKPESIFINRELSWLDFDSRVLALAKEKTVPLGERIKFAAIFGSNMDEFFMVRVGSLYDQTLLKNNKTDNVTHMTAAEQIAAITPRVAELQAKCDKYFQHLVTALAAEGYKKVDFAKLSKPQEHFWKTYFQRELFPLLSPQIVDSRHPFPFLNNKDIYYIAQLHTKNEGVSYGIVPVSSQFERVLFVKDGETACFAFVEELIAHYAATIFSASTVTKQCLFRVTRNADITVDEGMMDHDVDFRDVMSELLKKRRKLAAVRLQFWPDAPQEVVKFLRDKLVVPADRCYTQTSPLDSGALFKLAGRISGDGGHTELFYPTARPMQAPAGYDLYTEVRKHDVLLAYPYQSIRPFIKMLLRAGADPDVVSIKMTLYRMASDSQIVNALIAAAENGKEVVAMVELRARFDEQNNIDWSKQLEDAGCTVFYGFDDYKVHSKLTLITSRVNGQYKYLTQIGTGNYNEKTSELYTDLSFITTRQEIGEEASAAPQTRQPFAKPVWPREKIRRTQTMKSCVVTANYACDPNKVWLYLTKPTLNNWRKDVSGYEESDDGMKATEKNTDGGETQIVFTRKEKPRCLSCNFQKGKISGTFTALLLGGGDSTSVECTLDVNGLGLFTKPAKLMNERLEMLRQTLGA